MNLMEEKLQSHGDLEINVPLSKHTTFRIGGICKYFVYPKNEMSLLRIIELCKENKLAYRVFGKGSNLLCSDDYYDGVILCLDRYFNEIQIEEDGQIFAQAGVSLIYLAHEAMKASLSGLEFASGIPATLGGALYMNAGAYKSNMADIVKKVYVLKDDSCVWIDVDELAYAYRSSIFHHHRDWIILGARLQLKKGEQSEIKALMDSRRERRLASQPLNKPSAGSVFRNPQTYPAWQLIEEIGYRGKQIGGAKVSDKHANFIVNEDHAKASDVDALVKAIQKEVHEKYQIEMKMEVEKFNWQE
ncbi:MAG: UDP-N-acetylmuramate dehydrogenase [Erysipelotrichia bacterium]|nr:UDP-N-acetylmuramate dehydrogenase [Erysipelotrichia bacterium]NCC54123.1 UDP-N-acetylmuramate dehydrogenase [Erysipelotrichia bacterium]